MEIENDKKNTRHQANKLYTSSLRPSSVQGMEKCNCCIATGWYYTNDNPQWTSCNSLLDSDCNVCMILNDNKNGGRKNENS